MVAASFERTTRRVNLTPAGLALFTEARRVLAAAKVARSAVAEMQSLQRGRLMIGAIQGLSPFIDLPTAHGTRQLVDQSFAAAGLSRRSEVGVDDLTMQLDMVAHGLGVSWFQNWSRKAGCSRRPICP